MSRSTNISQLPNLSNNVTTNSSTIDGEDVEINAILSELNQEQSIQQGYTQPQVPMETMQQMPPMPSMQVNNMQQEYQQSNAFTTNNVNNDLQKQLLELQEQLSGGSKFNKIFKEVTTNLKLILVIILSNLILQNPRVQYFLTSKLIKLDIPYINYIILALTQVFLIVVGKNLW